MELVTAVVDVIAGEAAATSAGSTVGTELGASAAVAELMPLELTKAKAGGKEERRKMK